MLTLAFNRVKVIDLLILYWSSSRSLVPFNRKSQNKVHLWPFVRSRSCKETPLPWYDLSSRSLVPFNSEYTGALKCFQMSNCRLWEYLSIGGRRTLMYLCWVCEKNCSDSDLLKVGQGHMLRVLWDELIVWLVIYNVHVCIDCYTWSANFHAVLSFTNSKMLSSMFCGWLLYFVELKTMCSSKFLNL